MSLGHTPTWEGVERRGYSSIRDSLQGYCTGEQREEAGVKGAGALALWGRSEVGLGQGSVCPVRLHHSERRDSSHAASRPST